VTTVPALVVDTSAVAAVLFNEAAGDWLLDTLSGAERRYLSTGTYVELGIVVESRLGPTGAADRFIRDAEIELVEVTPQIASRALDGWRRYGKGRHPAGLNLGDCFAYGLASESSLPVLCVGESFARTDVDVLVP
jgi:ribonuclease VapC